MFKLDEDFISKLNLFVRLAQDAEVTKAYEVLGIEPPISLEELRRKHKALITEYHPDRHMSEGADKISFYQRKMQVINDAVNTLKKTFSQKADEEFKAAQKEDMLREEAKPFQNEEARNLKLDPNVKSILHESGFLKLIKELNSELISRIHNWAKFIDKARTYRSLKLLQDQAHIFRLDPKISKIQALQKQLNSLSTKYPEFGDTFNLILKIITDNYKVIVEQSKKLIHSIAYNTMNHIDTSNFERYFYIGKEIYTNFVYLEYSM